MAAVWRWGIVCLVALLLAWGLAQDRYIVQAGDSLAAIARRHGTSVDALMQANSLSSSLIRPGQQLAIPSVGGPAASPALGLPPGFRYYRLVSGDTLEAVAERFSLTVEALVANNPDTLHGDMVAVGTTLRIPPRLGTLVRLGPGQDVVSLSLAYGLSPSDLVHANGLSSARATQPGQWLFVPGVVQLPSRPASATTLPASLAAPPNRELLKSQLQGELSRAAHMLALYRPPQQAALPQSPAGRQTFVWPLPRRGTITSAFGPRNLVVAGSNFHTGLDIAAPVGTSILAVQDGVVSRAGWVGAYGYAVYVDHAGGLQTRYAHLNRIDVRPGERVAQGQQLGIVGMTGVTTGPHLHLEVRVSGRAVDPRPYLP